MNRAVIKDQLIYLGYFPTLVESGVDAITEIDRRKFDLILLDCNLPDISGYDVARHIRSSTFPGVSSTPIIAISADVDASHIELCLESGIDGVLPKPVNITKLKETLNAWIAGEYDQLDFNATTSKEVRDLNVFSGLKAEALSVLRCANNNDSNGVAFYYHRLKGAAMTFGHYEYLKFIVGDISHEHDFKKIRLAMRKLIREIDKRLI